MQLQLQIYVLVGATLFNTINGFGGGEEKFIKKYAMMKVYESCFGVQVLKEIRKEMKEAALKCSGFHTNYDDKYFNKDGNNLKHEFNIDWLHEPSNKVKPNLEITVKKPIHTTDTLLLQQWTEEQNQNNSEEDERLESESSSNVETETTTVFKKPIDFNKLEEAIMNIGKPKIPLKKTQAPEQTSNVQQSEAVGFYPAVYYPPPIPFAPSYPYHPYYPGYFQGPGPAGSAAFQSFYRSGHRSTKVTNFNTRMPKDVEVRPQLQSMAFHYSTKIRNITCIMQELGYLNNVLEPNYLRMSDRINKLNINEELKRDLLEGIQFCKQFSQCVPESKKDSFQLSKELLRPMFFFRCYKHKKLESCIMKDIRGRFSQTEELDNQVRRSFREGDIASTIFDSPFGFAEDFNSLF